VTPTVHVWGPPQGELVGFDERLCTEEDQGEETVFHTEPRTFLAGERMCLACGSVFFPKGSCRQC
jgi:hypothetical protein